MKNSIIHFNSEDTVVVGNVCIGMPSLVEVRILSPFHGFTLQQLPARFKEFTDDEQHSVAQSLLGKCYEISINIEQNCDAIKKDFLQLLTNLENFNNAQRDIYIRNRDELLGVFMRAHFSQFSDDNDEINYSDGLFNYLSSFFCRNGKHAELNIRTEFISHPTPPPFTDLPRLLEEYLKKSFEERLLMLVQQSISSYSHIYDWFLIQEFIGNEKKHNPLNHKNKLS